MGHTLTAALYAGLALAQAVPTVAPEARLDRAFLVGRWTDTANCSDAANFHVDGRFTASNGASGVWLLQGDQLTMTGSSTLQLRVVPVDRDTITVINPDGSPGRSTRCPGGDRGANLPLDGSRVTPAYISGRWTDNGDCGAAVTLAADGRFSTPSGGGGRWSLQGDRVTLTGGSSLVLQIVPVTRDRMLVVNPGGNLGQSTRC